MKNQLMYVNGALLLSVIALLAFLARLIFLDALFVTQFRSGFSEDRPWQVFQSMLVFMAFAGVWMWALLASARGSRAGMIGALIFNLLFAFFYGLLTLLVFCRPTGCAVWPAGNIIVWVALVAGLIACILLGGQLRQKKEHRVALGSDLDPVRKSGE